MFENLYSTLPGRVVARILASKWITCIAGVFMDSPLSRPLIRPFIKKNRIDLSIAEDRKYRSFNDFFTRRLVPGARPVCKDAGCLVSPCDGLLSVYPITPGQHITVKGQEYTMEMLLEDAEAASSFHEGLCMVFRLTPAHYHRYIFPADGEILSSRRIRGIYHTVRPKALENVRVFHTNSREYAVCSGSFGIMAHMEVGAMLVGRIVNEKTAGTYVRGEEKGRFEFGGSTIILFTQKDRIRLSVPANGESELPVLCGQKIGEIL